MCKLSIIIPIYNVEKYLRECLDSVLRQNFWDMEVILINDGSTDRSGELAEIYAKRYANVCLLTQRNKGLSAARNAGVMRAKGKYILFLDSDDYLMEDAVQELIEYIENKNLDLLLFSAVRVICDNQNIVKSREYYGYKHEECAGVSGVELYEKLQRTNDYYTAACFQIISRELLRNTNIKFYEGILHEDHLYTFLLMMNAKRCGLIPKAFYCYRYRENSIMNSERTYNRNLEGFLITYCEMVKWYKENTNLERIAYYRKVIEGHIAYIKECALGYLQLTSIRQDYEIRNELREFLSTNKFMEKGLQNKLLKKRVILMELRKVKEKLIKWRKENG